MGFLDKVKGLFKRNNEEFNFEYEDEILAPQLSNDETSKPIDLPDDELVFFTDEVLDTTSPEAIAKFKHNLQLLTQQAKQRGKVDTFKIVREDDNFPFGWEWDVLSAETSLDQEFTTLSAELRIAYALEQSGISPYEEIFFGVKIPRNLATPEVSEALSKVDKKFGSIALPSRFRSTKHFTVNTPLGATLDTNWVSVNRNFTIIDDMDAFLNSGYGYSTAYPDAYLDVAHESLPISPNAVVLINDEKYQEIMCDENIAKELAQRRVVRYKGDEMVATNMILTEMGALPYRVGRQYIEYDNKVQGILDSSMKNLAQENGLLYRQSHFGKTATEGHFSSYYDSQNKDHEKGYSEFITFLKQKFPEQEQLFSSQIFVDARASTEIIDQIGTTSLIDAINEYNEQAKQRLTETFEAHKQDRKKITPEIHQQFVDTVSSIQEFYQNPKSYTNLEVARSVIQFMQAKTVQEQVQASTVVMNLLPQTDKTKSGEKSEPSTNTIPQHKTTISINEAAKNALQSTTIERVNIADRVEENENSLESTKGRE